MNNKLSYISKKEITRITSLEIDKINKTELISIISRINTLYMINKAGSGHIGTSFSSMDLLSYIFSEFEINNQQNQNLFFSSKGHDAPAIYSIMTIFDLLDFEKIHQLRMLDGLPGHPDVDTPGIITNTGSLGMGVSKAKGFIKSARMKGINRNILVLLGDGELQEGQIWESLRSASNESMSEMYIIVDNNKIQSDNWVNLTSDNGDLRMKFESFGCHVEEIDGHNLSEIYSTFENLKSVDDKPKVIIANTIKGYGVSFMHADEKIREPDYEYPYHSGALSYEDYCKALLELKKSLNSKLENFGEREIVFENYTKINESSNSVNVSLLENYSKLLLENADNSKIVVMDGDLMKDHGLTEFKRKFPSKYIECGISEQDMVSQAGTLALESYIPIVHSFASFLTTRANEQIYNNATEKSKIVYVSGLCGLLPSGPGHSHQSVRDIGLMGNIPGMDVFHPASVNDLKFIIKYALDISTRSTFIRITSIPFKELSFMTFDNELSYGQGYIVQKGHDLAIFSYNPYMLDECIRASQLLEEHNISAKVINLPWLNYIDKHWFYNVTKGIDKIFTVEDHMIFTGLGSYINTQINDKNITNIGMTDIPVNGSNNDALKYHRLTAKDLVNKILAKINNEK
mgnify:CR=1 FL=1|tara:strand:+ start:3339 stop:5231 length:1893 start_codon:yes stop_codon:yes gene_type:complete